MTVTIYDIISANPVFSKILSHEFTGKQSFMISRVLRALNTETESFNKTREIVLRKYAELDDTGEMIIVENSVKIKDGEMAAFQKEINDLLYAELSIDVAKIPIEWLDSLKLTPQEMLALEPFVSME